MSAAPSVLRAGEGDCPRGDFWLKADRDELVLNDVQGTPGMYEPPPHVHHHHADAFYILEGELMFRIANGEHLLTAGDFVFAPPGLVHTYRAPGQVPARFINIHAPGCGFGDYMRGRPGLAFDQHEPPEDGGLPAEHGVLRRRGEGEPLRLGGCSALIKVGGGHGIGSLALLETVLEPGSPGPVLHTHREMVDSFYVLDGELTVTLGDETVALVPGDYALVPPGNAHTFANLGEHPVRTLNVMAPGGLERYLVEVAALQAAPAPEPMAQIAAKYDFEPA